MAHPFIVGLTDGSLNEAAFRFYVIQDALIVREVLDVMNQTALQLTAEQKTAVRHHFMITSKLEYFFWDMGYRQQKWKI